jgi:hypothetical protein
MKNELHRVMSVVADYVNDLSPAQRKKFYKEKTNDVDMDARALMFLASSNVFIAELSFDREYLYCFVFNEANIPVAKHIMKSNNLKPRLHISRRYYSMPTLALRTRVPRAKTNVRANEFIDKVMTLRSRVEACNDAKEYVEQLKQKLR